MTALLAFVLFAQQEAAKIEWRTDPEAAVKEASEFCKPMLVFFSAATCKNSKALSAGPFAAPKIVAAVSQFVAVSVDVDKDAAKWREKYEVRFTPTLLVLDRTGRRLEEITDREADPLETKLKEVAEAQRGPWAGSLAEALARGKKQLRPVVLCFWSDAAEKPHEKLHPAVAGYMDAVVLVTIPFKAENAEAKRFSVDQDKVWIVVDPQLEKPESELLGRFILKGEQDDAVVRERMKGILEEYLKAHPRRR